MVFVKFTTGPLLTIKKKKKSIVYFLFFFNTFFSTYTLRLKKIRASAPIFIFAHALCNIDVCAWNYASSF